MTKPVITCVEMAKNVVEMTYDAPIVYGDEFDDEFEQFQKLFRRDNHMYFTYAERKLIQGQLYNVFWSIQLVRTDEKNLNDESNVVHKYHLEHNAIYAEIKWEKEYRYGQSHSGKFEHINQVYLLREGLKTYLRK